MSLINDKVGGDESLLNTLYNFLEQTPPVNPLLASFVSKTFGNLITRKTEQVRKRASLCAFESLLFASALIFFILLFVDYNFSSGDRFPKEERGFYRAGVETLGHVGHDGSGAASH